MSASGEECRFDKDDKLMRFTLVMAGSALALALGACSPNFVGTSATGARPMGVASTAPGASSQMPQSPNSLPVGDAVSAPIDTNIGKIGTSRF